MNLNSKDIKIIERMLEYCVQIENTCERFGKAFETFESDFIYQNACSMCILQIGELSSHLSENFKTKHTNIPWKNIKGMRNIFAHNYGNMSLIATWETITEDIKNLKEFCLSVLSQAPTR